MLYTITEVANKLSLSTKTLRRWEEAGKLQPSRTLGGQRRYTTEEIQILDAIKHRIIASHRDLLTTEEAAKVIGVEVATMLRYQEEGKIHPLVTSSGLYYPKARLLAQIQGLSQPAPRAIIKAVSTEVYPNSGMTLILTNVLITLTILLIYHVLSNNIVK